MPASTISGEENDEDNSIVDIDELQNHGINNSDIVKLKEAHYYTIKSVQNAHSKELEKIKGFSDTKVAKIKKELRKCTNDAFGFGFMTAIELSDRRTRCFKLSTGSKQFDSILQGGFQSGSINEVFGEFRCGKTQIAHTLSVVAQLPRDIGGGAGKVVYIDTEGTFRPERIISIAERFGIDPVLARENILTARAVNSEHQMELINSLSYQFKDGEYRLLVVDSIMSLYRVDYVGRGELSERQQQLGKMLRMLTDLAEEFNIVVFMCNQVQSDPGASALFATDGRKPVGGHVLAHASTTRLLLRKGKGEERVAKIMDSPDCPEAESTYIITTGGIDDPSGVK